MRSALIAVISCGDTVISCGNTTVLRSLSTSSSSFSGESSSTFAGVSFSATGEYPGPSEPPPPRVGPWLKYSAGFTGESSSSMNPSSRPRHRFLSLGLRHVEHSRHRLRGAALGFVYRSPPESIVSAGRRRDLGFDLPLPLLFE